MVDTVIAAGETRTERLDMSGSDTLAVNGVFSVDDKGQTVRFDDETDGAKIVNRGTIENGDDGRAIRFEDVGERLVATIQNLGLIHSDDDAIQIDDGDLVRGKLIVSNGAHGVISSTDGQGVDLADATGAFLARVINAGAISADGNDGVRIGSNGQITNSGLIFGGSAAGYSDGSDGVQFEDDATGTVTNTGRIFCDRHAVNAGEGSTITVVNRAGGTITGRNGSGVGSDGSATVINRGKIYGQFSDSAGSDVHGHTVGAEDGGGPDGVNDGDGDGVDIDFLAHIQNYGVIRGLGAGGTGSDGLPNTSEGIAAGGGVIENFAGAGIAGADTGILIDDSSQGNAPFLTEIENHGVIAGGTSFGVRIISALDDVITNGGRIVGGDGVAIEFGSGDNRLAIETGSVIVGVTRGGDGDDTLDYHAYGHAVSVDLGAGTATGTGGVESFERVTGSSAADTILGSDDGDTLSGGRGADSLAGGTGDDLYNVDDAGDRVVEAAGGGVDTVATTVSYALAAGQEIEKLKLAAGALGATVMLAGNETDNAIFGNAAGNVLDGAAGDDTLSGGGGADTLTGGAGDDLFLFNAAPAAAHAASVTDFDVGHDVIGLGHAAFGLAQGALAESAFAIGSVAESADVRVLYDQASGALLFDHDGAGGDAAVKFAELDPGLHLTSADFRIV